MGRVGIQETRHVPQEAAARGHRPLLPAHPRPAAAAGVLSSLNTCSLVSHMEQGVGLSCKPAPSPGWKVPNCH